MEKGELLSNNAKNVAKINNIPEVDSFFIYFFLLIFSSLSPNKVTL